MGFSWKKTWNFIWHDNSVWSWIVNVILAFVLVKFIIYPVLGLLLMTSHPIVAVVSESMEHGLYEGKICGESFEEFDKNFDNYWKVCGGWYEKEAITKEQFEKFRFKNGFNKGDIIFLKGVDYDKIRKGDVIVFRGISENGDPIIHRVVKITEEGVQTKGDHNSDSFSGLGEKNIKENDVIGRALFRVPYLGWIKVGAVDLIKSFNGGI